MLRVTNKLLDITERDFVLKHGSLFTMSRESQCFWYHEIVEDRSVSEPRISFTFRRLLPHDRRPVKPRVPPIAPPKPPKLPQSIAPTGGTHSRILFLTDSVLSKTPTHLFGRVEGHKCIKKENYELKNIFNFSPEFGYSNYVVISCGVNDLSRYGCRAHTLADLVCKRLRHACQKYKNTIFIFNSLVSTSFSWLNREIGEFNNIMFDMACEVENLYFFDSHDILMSGAVRGDVVDRYGNGIHMTVGARELVSWELVTAVAHLQTIRTGRETGSRSRRPWYWPLRPEYIRQLQLNSRRAVVPG